ncbi:recombination mediator RecR [Patescibacteria group bacterium]|nr:recombination mediator RecR [Patescibacteria group bacterium]MBU1663516.1 recombination mediator RecR [Patescibacteria group bacterium]MBU1933778.1 recombination mediator RecR [Patescibacteria group bacterium]MBU2007830.1 recombination mediator RecR [Patescibacteria group bacterium]MBU2233255.1 recombination mediator RecR [Patescibacteria group bacterium]
MKYPTSIQNLIEYFSKLPTVGPKTAERYVFYLLRQHPEWLQQFAQAIAEVKEKTTICQTCLSIAESNPCQICSDKKRNHSVICLVADTRDMLAVESTKQYNGVYHILGGVINTIEGIKPNQLNIKALLNHLEQSASAGSTQAAVKEIILAFNPDLEGETTSMYIAKLLKPYKIKITRLAKGLPMGADLEYADEITLSNALKYRNEV